MGTEALWKVVVYIVEIIAWCIGPMMEIVKNSYSRVYTDLIHQSYVVFWVFLPVCITSIICLLEEVAEVRFFETDDKGVQTWKKSGSFTTDKHIHEKVAIKLVYPAYRETYFRENQRKVSVELILKRGTKEHKSAPVDFYYLPGIRDYMSLLCGFLPPLIIIPNQKQ